MKIRKVHLVNFKRFNDLTIDQIPETTKLVVLIGPNGSGKTSVFEGFRQWSGRHGRTNVARDEQYISRDEEKFEDNWKNRLQINFHNDPEITIDLAKKAFHIRSAYRNDPDFVISQLQKVKSALDSPGIGRLIDNDSSVMDNYQRLISKTIENVYGGENDDQSVQELREQLIGEIRNSMLRVFEDLNLNGPGNPLNNGTFLFDKGDVSGFHYKNLSGGEKAAFDILLDLIIKRVEFDDTIFCIDEPDLHMHTKLQGALLEEIFNLVPDVSQLWISTHSIGMMKKAVELYTADPTTVVFLDFHGHNFDEVVTLTPKQLSKNFWRNCLQTALDDLSDLVVPSQIVLCEGGPAGVGGRNPEFDAKCYNLIFESEYPDSTFISVGGEDEVRNHVDLVTTIQSLANGVEFLKLVDKDDKTNHEIADLNAEGIKVLGRRHIESYLLDNEIIGLLCNSVGQPELMQDCIEAKNNQLQNSVQDRNNPPDDIKSISGGLYTDLRRILNLVGAGGNISSFLRDTMAPLITPQTETYKILAKDIFEN